MRDSASFEVSLSLSSFADSLPVKSSSGVTPPTPLAGVGFANRFTPILEILVVQSNPPSARVV